MDVSCTTDTNDVTDIGTPWDVHRQAWQAVLNERPIPARRAQVSAPTPVPVTARVAWEREGVEQVDTVAWGWTARDVLVELADPRRFVIGIWLPATDVRRRRHQMSRLI